MIIKYSTGTITSIVDKNTVQSCEEISSNKEELHYLISCHKCGLQYMDVKNDPSIVCCGDLLIIN